LPEHHRPDLFNVCILPSFQYNHIEDKMAEKSGNQSADVNLTENNLAYLRATLCSLDSVKPNFAMVSEDWGLGKGGHGYVILRHQEHSY